MFLTLTDFEKKKEKKKERKYSSIVSVLWGKYLKYCFFFKSWDLLETVLHHGSKFSVSGIIKSMKI